MQTLIRLVICSAATVATAFSQAAGHLAISHLVCEGLAEPTAIDVDVPRFSWRLESPDRGTRQMAYQLRIAEIAPGGLPLAGATVETPRLASDQSQWVAVSGFSPKPKTRYQWQVCVWDERGRNSGWSAPASFETGLRGQAWPEAARWIGDGRTFPRDQASPARYFRTEFDLGAQPVRARLYWTAFGIAEPWINGAKVGNDYFLPGWPDYRKRVFYVASDVTGQVKPGRNALGFIVANGWLNLSPLQSTPVGSEPLVSAYLEITDASGKVTSVATGQQWQWAEGPIVAQGLYYGEDFDARRDDASWSNAGGGTAWTWRPAQVKAVHAVATNPRVSPPVRRIQEVNPISRREIRPGVFLYDLGQNMVGWVRLRARAKAGQEIQIRFAEMLESPEKIFTANLRSARATAKYVARGGGVETWEPRFSFFGFRYVEVTGLEQTDDEAITGIVVHSDLPRIGHFECSNPLLNRLYSNTVWGQRGNFLEIPTDCPQRDERWGWTGDAQVFADTANYNYASDTFFRQWLAAVRDGYREDRDGPSGFPDMAPDLGFGYGSAGWGEAAAIVPYVTWLHTGDRRLLEENFDAIQRWVEEQAREYPDGIRRSRTSFGDWLAPGFPAGKAPTPYVLIATAYFARLTDLASRMATELGRADTAEADRALLGKIKGAFSREFIDPDGRIASDEQTACLLALGFGLVPDSLREKVIANVVRTFAAKNDHLATGFIGTPLVMPVLSATGHPDVAYRVLLQESYPGWLYSVKNGATTIWERWDSWTPERGFNPDGMNSFNHYAYGSIVGWFYDTIAGLCPEERAAGWKRFSISPTPGGGLTSAKATLESPYGMAASGWQTTEAGIYFDITVPPNTTALVRLPTPSAAAVKEGDRMLGELHEVSGIRESDHRVAFTLAPGTYRFVTPAAR